MTIERVLVFVDGERLKSCSRHLILIFGIPKKKEVIHGHQIESRR